MEWHLSIEGEDAPQIEGLMQASLDVTSSWSASHCDRWMNVEASERQWEQFFHTLKSTTPRGFCIGGCHESRPSEPYDPEETLFARGGVSRGVFFWGSWMKSRDVHTKESFVSLWWEDAGTIYEQVAPWHTQGISFDEGIEFLRSGDPWTKVWEMQILTLLYHTDTHASEILCEYLFKHSARGRYISSIGLLPFKDEM